MLESLQKFNTGDEKQLGVKLQCLCQTVTEQLDFLHVSLTESLSCDSAADAVDEGSEQEPGLLVHLKDIR